MVEESALEEDIDGLCEMVSACLPEFSTIEKEAVSKWLLDVESKLKQESKENENCQSHSDPMNHISLAALLPAGAQRMRVHHLSETSDAGSDSSGEYFSEVREEVRAKLSTFSDILHSQFSRVCVSGILLASNGSAARDVSSREPCRSETLFSGGRW
jgi:hypothetical protein